MSPLLKGSSKHSFNFKVSPFDTPLVHIRGRGRGIFDAANRAPMEDANVGGASSEESPVIYAGPLIPHFGHFISECVHRLYPKSVFEDLKTAKIAYHTTERAQLRLPTWAASIFELFNVSVSDIVLINKNTKFKNLYIPIQGRVLGGPSLIKDYSDILPLNKKPIIEPKTDSGRKYYISRINHIYSGSYLGESLIQNRLQHAGFTVLYPEDIPTLEMVGILRGADVVVFGEGSAIHNLELCGRTRARVFVIGRRAGSFARFRYILEDYTADWRIFDKPVDGTPLDWDDVRDRPSIQRACSYIRLDELIAELSDFIGAPLSTPTPEEIKDAMRSDLSRFILDPRSTRDQTSNEHLGELLRTLRSQFHAIQNEWASPNPSGDADKLPS